MSRASILKARAMTATKPIPTAASWLGCAGLLPFGAAALAALWPAAPLHALALPALLAYGAVILSFLGGIHWGLAMASAAPGTLPARLGFSVLPSLLGWVALLLPPAAGLVLLAAGFAAMLLLDLQSEATPVWYPRLRLPLSLGAMAALLLGLAA